MNKYAYLFSPAHSGSTLLDLLLGSHSKMEALGEIALLPKNISLNTNCSCGLAVCACPMWVSVINQISKEIGQNIFTNPYALNTGYPKASIIIDKNHQTNAYLLTRKFVHGLVYLQLRYDLDIFSFAKEKFQNGLEVRYKLYDTIIKNRNVNVSIDSSKFYLDGLALYKYRPKQMRVILLSRDGRGVMHSNLKRKLTQKASVRSWFNYYNRTLPLIKRNVSPQHLLQVRYEDLAQNTEQELVRICDFLGVSFESSMLDFSSHTHHVTNGNDMRFSNSSIIKLDTSWKKGLSKENLDYFAEHAGKLNKELGYI